MQGSYSFDAPLETVWNALFDPEVLARTLPGCEKLERVGNQFKGDINVKMGPVQGKFQGKVDILDVKERESYTMIVDGRGPAGFGKATALMRVQTEGSGTRLDYDSDVTVGGKIASVGQRLIDASSRAIVKQSLEGLHQQIKALAPQTAAPVAAAPVAPVAAVATAPRAPMPGPSPATTPAVPHSAPLDPTAPPQGSAPLEGSAAPAGALLEGSAAPAPGAPQPGNSAGPAPDLAWFAGARKPAPAAARPPGAASRPPSAPSQASFVFGVAKEVAKEMLPLRAVLLVVALLVLAWVIFRSVSGG
jgi:carbon monoxide dehydrogenase subunit G